MRHIVEAMGYPDERSVRPNRKLLMSLGVVVMLYGHSDIDGAQKAEDQGLYETHNDAESE